MSKEDDDKDVSGAVQPGGPWQPDPNAMWGRIDTSAGENGSHLYKINPHVWGVNDEGGQGRGAEVDGPATPEDIELQPSAVGSGIPDDNQTPDGAPAGAQFNPPAGTVDTSGPEGVHHEDFDPIAVPHTVGGEPNDANVDPSVLAGGPSEAEQVEDDAQRQLAEKAITDKDYDSDDIFNHHLKDELEKRQLGVGGNRAALVKRLKDDDKAKAKQADTTES